MEVQLYVYDLSQGLARQYSQALTGVHIDAVYHTAIVLDNVEYFFGQGIHRKIPGTTHHGRPMSVVPLGQTQLPSDVIQEYIESLEAIYTPESYDLFLHNCNNFTQDLAMFLVGKSIPDEIRSLPETFLNTPIGRMLRGQIDQSMRQMTQAPDAMAGRDAAKSPQVAATPRPKPAVNGVSATPPDRSTNAVAHVAHSGIINAQAPEETPGHVYNVTTTTELDRLLEASRQSCAVVFFTSATCAPCHQVYPLYDELASEATIESGARLIKIDMAASPAASAVAQRYHIRATPTFVSFLKGNKQDEWTGANPAQLKGNVRLLLQMARPPLHPHARLKLPSFQKVIQAPIMYTRTPPLDKLLAKTGADFAQHQSVQDLVRYITTRDAKGMNAAALPNLPSFSHHVTTTYPSLPAETRFAVIDLVRVAAVDPRVSSFLVTEPDAKALAMILEVSTEFVLAPYSIQSVSLQLACNLFSSNIFQEQIYHADPDPANRTPGKPQLRPLLEMLAAQCLLSPHPNARSIAAALVYNLAAYGHNGRIHAHSSATSSQGEDGAISDDLGAALLESIISLSTLAQGTSPPSAATFKDTLHALLLALGTSLYAAPADVMLWDLCRAMDLQESLTGITRTGSGMGDQAQTEPLLKEVGEELLGRGAF